MQCAQVLCEYFSSEISPICVDLYEEYKEVIIELLENGYNPDQICQLLKLCE